MTGCLAVTAATARGNPYLDRLREGWNVLGKGQIAHSGQIFAEAVSLDPQHPAGRLSLAVSFSLQRNWKLAGAEYQTVLTTHSHDAVAWNGLGIVHLQQGQSAEALSCFEKALEIEPDYAAARSHLAFVLCLYNLPDRALEECARVIKSKPAVEVRGFVQKTRALAFLLKQHHDEALTALGNAWREMSEPKATHAPSWLALDDPRAAFGAIAHPLFVTQKLPEPRMVASVPPVTRNGGGQPPPSPAGQANSPTRASPLEHKPTPPEQKPSFPPPPTVTVTFAPCENPVSPIVRGTVMVIVNVSGSASVRYLRLDLGGRTRSVFNALPYQWRWNTLVDNDGDHELVVRTYSAMSQLLSEHKFRVRVQNTMGEPAPSNQCFEADDPNATSSGAVSEFPTSNEELEFARQRARPLLVLSAQPNALRYLKSKVHQSQENWHEAYHALMEIYVEDSAYLDVRAQILMLRDRIYKMPTDEVLEIQSAPQLGNVVSITFDDGPRSPYTERILATLRLYNVKATFFLVGKMVDLYPELVQQIVKDGHELASHSYLHYNMERMTPLMIEKELLRCEHALRRVTGQEIRLFRPPGGHYDEDVRQAIIGLGYKTIFWTANITSFPLLPPPQIADKLVERVGQGGIILLHNGMDKSSYVLPRLLQLLKARGTQCVTVGQMLEMQKRR
jgi:peptidoglycan/xylan/chitin deacetylase (PgdA/CDA1 family)